MRFARHRVLVASIVGGVLLAGAPSSEARTESCKVREKVWDCPLLTIEPGMPVTITLIDSPVLELDAEPPGQAWKVQYRLLPGGDTVRLWAPRRASPAQIVGSLALATRRFTAHFHVKPASATEPHVDSMIVEFDDPRTARLLAQQKAALEKQHREELTARDRHIRAIQQQSARDIARLERQLAEREDTIVLDAVLGGLEQTAIPYASPADGGLQVRRPYLGRVGNVHILSFTLHNPGPRDIPIDHLAVFDRDQTANHAARVEIGNPTERPPSLLGQIPAHSDVKVVVKLRGPAQHLGEAFQLAISGPGIVPQLEFVPLQEPDEYERMQRAKRSFVSLRVLGGAFWIADGFGNDELAATSFTGIGLRFTKGIVPMVAFEAELAGLRTGTAEFSDVDLDGTRGDLNRRATLARAQLGGVLRFGDKVIPTARLGIGAQGGSFRADMTLDGGSMADLDSNFEFNGFVTFGAGVDVRLGDQLLAGIGAAAELSLGESREDLFRRSLNISGHLGYGW